MLNYLIIVLCMAVAIPALAQQAQMTKSIALDTPMRQPNGKPLLDDSKQDKSMKFVTSAGLYGKNFKAGDTISDAEELARITAELKTEKAPAGGDMTFLLEPVDPTCKNCPPITLGWVIAQALTARVCPAPGSPPTVPKSSSCTEEEQKAEADYVEMAARTHRALEIMGLDKGGDPEKAEPMKSIVLGDKSKVVVENLIKARFSSAPDLVAQAIQAIGGQNIVPEWGKD